MEAYDVLRNEGVEELRHATPRFSAMATAVQLSYSNQVICYALPVGQVPEI